MEPRSVGYGGHEDVVAGGTPRCAVGSPVWRPFPSTVLYWTAPRVPAQGHVLARLLDTGLPGRGAAPSRPPLVLGAGSALRGPGWQRTRRSPARAAATEAPQEESGRHHGGDPL